MIVVTPLPITEVGFLFNNLVDLKPDMKLSKKEAAEVKRVARQLLAILKKEKLVLDWKKKQQTRAGVKLTIEKTLDELPEIYSTEVYN